MSGSPIQFHAIGHVENEVKELLRPSEIKAVPSRIILDPQLVEGLTGLTPGQEVMIVFHFHRSPNNYDLLQHPKHDLSRPKRGVFALRTPQRPNAIGVSTVNLTGITDNVLHVENLDAVNRTPVLDIKPIY